MTAQYDVRTLVEEEFCRRHDCAQAGVVRDGDPVTLRQWHVEVDAHKHVCPPQVHTFGDVSRRSIASLPVRGRA